MFWQTSFQIVPTEYFDRVGKIRPSMDAQWFSNLSYFWVADKINKIHIIILDLTNTTNRRLNFNN